MPKSYTATIKCMVTVKFTDDGSSELTDQAADQFNDGNFYDPEIYDITDIEETQNDNT